MLESLLLWDKELFLFFQNRIDPSITFLVPFLAESIVIWAMTFLVGSWIYGAIQKNDAYKILSLRVFYTIITVFIFYSILNFGIPQWRPHPGELIPATMRPIIPHPLDNSFPSGHAIFSTAFLMAALMYIKNIPIIATTAIFAIITLCLRVLGGVHYPGDILGGIVVGILGVFILRRLVDILVNFTAPYAIRIAKILHL